MTTTATTSAAASSASSQNIASLLGAGSGVDIQALAKNLVAAEQQPREEAINAKIGRSEARITGYGALKSLLSELRAAFQTIDDASEFASISVANTQPAALSVTTGPNAATGSLDVQVTQVAQGTRQVFAFDTRAQPLNTDAGGVNQPFTIAIRTGAGTSDAASPAAGTLAATVTVTTPTPAGIASAINGSATGLSARLVDTGSGVRLVVTGPEGAANDFRLEPAATAVAFPAADAAAGLSAADAVFKVNGVEVTRPSNTVDDVVDGVTLKLATATTGTARLDLTRQATAVVDRIKAFVASYNTFLESAQVMGDRESTVETYGAALAGDPLLRTVTAMVRRMITDTSTTAAGVIKAPRDVGLSLDRDGKLTLDESRLSTALQKNFDQVVSMFTAGKDNKSPYGTAASGSAGEAVRTLTKLLSTGGLIDAQDNAVNNQLTAQKEQLVALQERMQRLLQRYIEQFTAMDTLVGASRNTQSSLTSTFEAMTSGSD